MKNEQEVEQLPLFPDAPPIRGKVNNHGRLFQDSEKMRETYGERIGKCCGDCACYVQNWPYSSHRCIAAHWQGKVAWKSYWTACGKWRPQPK